MPKYNFKKAFNGKTNRSYAKQIGQGLASKAIMRRQIGRGLKYVKQQFGGMQPMNAGMISGMGDYKVHKRGYTTGRGFTHGKSHRAPRVHLEKGEMCITHTEYIGDLISGVGVTNGQSPFLSQSYACNPSNPGTFPWLSSVSQQFQEYKFQKLVFEFRPLVSEGSLSSNGGLMSMGSVILATQYNSAVGPYLNKATMAESDYAVTTKPSEHILHAIECDVKYNPMGVLYTSAQTSLTVGAGNTDIRMQNLGIFQAASVGIPMSSAATPTAISLGELWVHYTVKLFKPVLSAGLSSLESAHYYTNTTAGGIVSGGNPFGTAISPLIQPIPAPNNLLTLTFTPTSFSFPLSVTTGSYLVAIYWKSSAVGVPITIGTTTFANCTPLQCWNQGAAVQASQYATSPNNGGTTSQIGTMMIVQINAPGSQLASLTFAAWVLPTTPLFDIVVTPYNSIMN